MTDLQSFEKAVRSDLDDVMTRLAYADWIEERSELRGTEEGRELAAFLRGDECVGILLLLPDATCLEAYQAWSGIRRIGKALSEMGSKVVDAVARFAKINQALADADG